MKKSILKHALGIARAKLSSHPQYNHFMHYSFVVQFNKIVEWSVNNSKLPPVHYGYKDRIKDKAFRPKTHSEIEAFRCARGLLDLNKPFEMINIRLSKNGEVRLSKPCVCCRDLLTALGCVKFYYSSEVGFLS